ncbi:MAG TPA: histidine kinase [Gaiellaceae bacterium]|jgi:signal transduction histidine kinase|nr:histidine kinase [Gaiellaceae bacterium]
MARAPFLLDLAIVLAVAVIAELNVWVFDSVPGPAWLTAALPLLIALPLLWRRAHALPVVALVFGGIVLQAVASGDSAEGFQLVVASAVAAYSVGAFCRRTPALVGLAVVAVGYAIYAAEDHNIESGRTSELWAGAFFGAGLLAAWLVGSFVHHSSERAALEERERRADSAVAEERLRLARELHDIVSHNLSVVVVQAGGARAGGGDASTLEKIEESGREALVEMRRLLGVLRDDDASATTLAPQPGVAELAALADSVRSAGVDVELLVDGDAHGLPAAVDLSVYRIVQEALTNTLKHAAPARAEVRVRCTSDSVTVDVVDDGARPSSGVPGGGHGLVGMRERVALFGGELRAEPLPEGGFGVHARLPRPAS